MQKFEYYEASDGWRWRLLATNGQTIATGGEAYSTKQHCLGGIDSVLAASNVIGSMPRSGVIVESES